MRDNAFPIGASLFRRHALAQIGFISAAAGRVFDYDFFVRLTAAGHQAYYLDKRLMRYRVHHGQLTANSTSLAYRSATDMITVLAGYHFDRRAAERARREKLAQAEYAAGIASLRLGQLRKARFHLRHAIQPPLTAPRALPAWALAHGPARVALQIAASMRRS
ncbi:MAG: hypothetical protein M1396_06165 [Chloroflexi bacterium]|nr:hypothetical protein [Chloroflexota bacterium]